jgi:hypothetical protein
MEQAKAHRPSTAELGEPPHQQPGQHHVQGADEDSLPFRIRFPIPISGILATHQHVYGHVKREVSQPALDHVDGLLHQRALRQHDHQPARGRLANLRVRMSNAPVQPRQHRSQGLTGPSRHPQYVRQPLFGEPGLIAVRARATHRDADPVSEAWR